MLTPLAHSKPPSGTPRSVTSHVGQLCDACHSDRVNLRRIKRFFSTQRFLGELGEGFSAPHVHRKPTLPHAMQRTERLGVDFPLAVRLQPGGRRAASASSRYSVEVAGQKFIGCGNE
jgi:hypothetical protein